MAFCENCGNALNPTAKFCGGCGNQVETTSQDTNQHSVDETPPPKHGYQRAPGNDMGITTSRPAGRIWYLLPLLFGIFGGIIAYAVIRNRNPRRARNTLILGVVFLLAHFLLIVGFDDDFEIDSQLSEEEIRNANAIHICARFESANNPVYVPKCIKYDDLLRNNGDHVGKIVNFGGEVVTVYNDSFLLATCWDDTYCGTGDRIKVNYNPSSIVVIADNHRSMIVVGKVIGLETFTSFTGKQTVPEVKGLMMNGELLQ